MIAWGKLLGFNLRALSIVLTVVVAVTKVLIKVIVTLVFVSWHSVIFVLLALKNVTMTKVPVGSQNGVRSTVW
jgi:hypothetical protein